MIRSNQTYIVTILNSKMNKQFSLEEFLDPCILEWMDINSHADSEQAATVMRNSGDSGFASVP